MLKITQSEFFAERFSISLTTPLHSSQYRIRYRVYCEEMGFESTDKFPDGLEMDCFDSGAIHAVITHRQTGMPVACVRVIRADNNHQLPIEKHCGEDIAAFALVWGRNNMAEVSRIAIVSEFRKRSGESDHPIALTNKADHPDDRRVYPQILPSALYLGVLAILRQEQLPYGLALINPILRRHLRQFGIKLILIGEQVYHRGVRVPCAIDVAASIRAMEARNDGQVEFLEFLGGELFGGLQ